jgi:CRISPR-associated protein Csb1
MIKGLEDEPRIILTAKLEPAVGSAFQPTGFPDLGAAEFERPISDVGSQSAVLVESVQSLANHLERVGWDSSKHGPVNTLARLPYVEVRDKENRFLTSSRLEPHRLAGSYIKKATVDGNGGKTAGDWMIERLGVQKGVPLDWRAVYAAILQLDPLCLLHGVFFSDPLWKDYGNPKVRRALTAVIEAHDARPVVSGGVKRDDVFPTIGEGRSSKEGFGFVPFGRTEYTAAAIELHVAIDLEQIRGYGLGDDETDLLTAVALWEVQTLLGSPMRLRTACDLEVREVIMRRPVDWALPTTDALAQTIEGTKVKFEADVPHKTLYGS